MISRKMNEQVLSGALSYHKNFLAGPYKGYYITIDYKPPVYIVYIHATFDNLPGKAQFESFLKEHEATMQYLSKAEAKQHTIKLRIIEPKPKKLTPGVLNDTIEPVIRHLLGCRYDTGCINCGDNDGKIDCYEVSSYHHYLCEQCVVDIEKEFKEKQIELNEITSNPLTGSIGAIVGSLLGVIAWVALSANNLFASLAGIAILFLAYKGYEMLGIRIDKKGFAISTAIACIMIFLGNHLSWSWAIMDAAKLEGYSIGEILLLFKIMRASNFTTNYVVNLLVGYVITYVLGNKIIRMTYRKSMGSYCLRKLNLQ